MGLVLTVGVGDKVKIGDDIMATVTRCSGGKVKLDFNAPKSVKINRIMKPEGSVTLNEAYENRGNK